MSGLFSACSIPSSTLLVSIPSSLFITTSCSYSFLSPFLNALSPRALLSLCLLYEKKLGPDSFFFPYIEILPKNVLTPLWFREEEMELLEGTNLEVGVKKRKESLIKEWKAIRDLHGGITWPDYLWAVSIITSRAFPYSLVDPSDKTSAEVLIPLADALNHEPRRKILWKYVNDTLEIITEEDIGACAQIFNNYGPKSNEELLLGYGFTIRNNPDDWVAIKVSFSNSSTLSQTQIPSSSQTHSDDSLGLDNSSDGSSDGSSPPAHIPSKNYLLSIGGLTNTRHFLFSDYIPSALLAQLRVLVMTDTELELYMNAAGKHWCEFVGYRNELAMLEAFRELVWKKISGLKRGVKQGKLKNARREVLHSVEFYREGQKYILENTLSHISTRTNMVISLALSELHSSRKLYPPFLKINNATLKTPVFSSLPSSSVNPITALVISIDNAMNDKLFADAVRKVIDNIYEEEDVALMLYLIYERQNTTSLWRKFFQAVDGYIMMAESDEEEKEKRMQIEQLHRSLQLGATSSIFSDEVYTIDSFIWAANIIDTFSLTFYQDGAARTGIVPT